MSQPVITVAPGTPLKEVAAILVGHGISAAPVVTESGELVGIVSESDLLHLEAPDPRRHIAPQPPGGAPLRTAADAMTREVVALPEDADVAEVARAMLDRGVKRIPILSAGRITGIVSRRDILKVLARSDGEIRDELQELLDDEVEILGRFESRVSEGIVTLRGPRERAGRRLAELLARSVPGVVAVRFEDPS